MLLTCALRTLTGWTLGIALVVFSAVPVCGDELSLAEKIDRLIEANSVGPVAPLASDADFVRRAWLDLAGCVPPASVTKKFLDNQSPKKRAELVDELLASPQFLRHFTTVLDVMLMERRPEKAVKNPEFQQYLFESLAAEKPLDQLFRELISADGVQTSPRAAVRFILDRDCESHALTRDIGRLVFGRDLQCAQCHDHPVIDDYYQAEYYGLQAFLLRSSMFTDTKTKFLTVSEKAEGEASFQSVFTKIGSDRTYPRLPLGKTFVDPMIEKGAEYVVAPSKTERAVPKFSRRAQLAAMIAENDQFRRNIANRIWAMAMGRGLVHPLDGHHEDNPPSHPQVLTLLAEEVAARQFNLKSMLRELFVTRTYQRSCDPPQATVEIFSGLEQQETDLTAEVTKLEAAVKELRTAAEERTTAWRTATAERTKQLAELTPLEAEIAKVRGEFDKVEKELTAAKAALTVAEERQKIVADAATQAQAAAEKIGKDKILTDAAAQIAARATALLPAVKAAQTKVETANKSVEAANAKLTAAREALAAKRATFPSDEAWLALEQQELAAIRAHLAVEAELGSARSRLTQVKLLREYQQLEKSDAEAADKIWQSLVETWTNRGQLGSLRPLSAEQLAFSMMQSTEMLAAQRAAASTAVEKSPPEELKNATAEKKTQLRNKWTEHKMLDQVRAPLATFVNLFDGGAGQEFQATANQALFLGNNNQVLGWLTPANGNLVQRLSKVEDSAELGQELYLAVYSRRPTESEQQTVTQYLESRQADKVAALQEMIWGLLTSNEFRFNH